MPLLNLIYFLLALESPMWAKMVAWAALSGMMGLEVMIVLWVLETGMNQASDPV